MGLVEILLEGDLIKGPWVYDYPSLQGSRAWYLVLAHDSGEADWYAGPSRGRGPSAIAER